MNASTSIFAIWKSGIQSRVRKDVLSPDEIGSFSQIKQGLEQKGKKKGETSYRVEGNPVIVLGDPSAYECSRARRGTNANIGERKHQLKSGE